MDSPTQPADEQAILRIAKELVDELNISSFKPVSVSWAEDVPWTLPDSEYIMPELAGTVKREVPLAGVSSLGTESFSLPV